MSRATEKIKEKLEDQLAEYAGKQMFNPVDLEAISKITCIISNIDKMGSGYSERGYSRHDQDRDYSERGSYRGYSRDEGSYADGSYSERRMR